MAKKLHRHQKDRISTEMYLKTIYQLKNPHLIDVVNELKVAKSSVSEMLRKLEDDGYITYASFKPILLTAKGMKIGKQVSQKYEILTKFLREVLKIPESDVHHEACNLEHAFSDGVIKKLKQHMA